MTIHENDFGIERVSMTKEEFIINRLTYFINGNTFIEIDGKAIEVILT
jgi:hypothetical protein|tara:strand:- start:529 stop:672 length:144 start_codon:yes stop_codon:yes gene_type:complete